MPATPWRDSTLVLVGHGSTVNARSAAAVRHHAENLGRRNLFAEVQTAFWLVEPKLNGLWDRIRTPRVIVVPVFISEGYFTTEAIPGALGLLAPPVVAPSQPQRIGNRAVHYCEPVGTHPAMTEALLARARSVQREHPSAVPASPSHTTLVIAGHGTERNAQSRAAIDAQVAALDRRRLFAAVRPAFLGESPLIADCVRSVSTPNVVVVPFFISDGLHTLEDIPVLLGEREEEVRRRLDAGEFPWRNPTPKGGKQVWYTAAIGTEPFLAEVILERVREAVPNAAPL